MYDQLTQEQITTTLSFYFLPVCSDRVDLVFAIDASTSIGDANFENVIEFVRDVIVGLRIGTSDTTTSSRVGIVTFSDDATVLFHLNVRNSRFYSIFYYSNGIMESCFLTAVQHEVRTPQRTTSLLQSRHDTH